MPNELRFDDSERAVYERRGESFRWTGTYYGYGISPGMSYQENAERVYYVEPQRRHPYSSNQHVMQFDTTLGR